MYISTNHTSFTVSNLERSISFYTDTLGMKLLNVSDRDPEFSELLTGIPGAHMRIAYLAVANYQIELIQYLSPKGKKIDSKTCNIGSAHVAFNVNDLRSIYNKLLTEGVRFISPPCIIPEGPNKGGFVVYLEDPDNNTIELIEPHDK